MRGGNAQVVPVFRNRPARHPEVMPFFQDNGYVLVAERLPWIFLRNDFSYQVHDHRRGAIGAVIPSNAGAEEEFHCKRAEGRSQVLIGRNAAHRRFVDTNAMCYVFQV